ncbi:YqgQ family protein [Heyndrickxia sp. NPDC080065]|uniref:YqgQ family protein n=1 Tax=Heyndrickxia sp. NPDC080065 TaxID=3390568 RepID=UPI003D023DA8
MKTFYDVQQLLKKFGIIIYVGDRSGDIELMEREIRELYKNQLIEQDVFQLAILILKHERQNCKKIF